MGVVQYKLITTVIKVKQAFLEKFHSPGLLFIDFTKAFVRGFYFLSYRRLSERPVI